MTTLLFGHDEKLIRWAVQRFPRIGADFPPGSKAIGIASGDGTRLYGVWIYHNYDPAHGLVQISFAAASPKWATKGNIRALLSVPFDQYGCHKVFGVIEADNARSLKFAVGIGWKKEATLRHHFGRGRHVYVVSMLAHEYRARWAPQAQRMAA